MHLEQVIKLILFTFFSQIQEPFLNCTMVTCDKMSWFNKPTTKDVSWSMMIVYITILGASFYCQEVLKQWPNNNSKLVYYWLSIEFGMIYYCQKLYWLRFSLNKNMKIEIKAVILINNNQKQKRESGNIDIKLFTQG